VSDYSFDIFGVIWFFFGIGANFLLWFTLSSIVFFILSWPDRTTPEGKAKKENLKQEN
jgi:hypothetical protein